MEGCSRKKQMSREAVILRTMRLALRVILAFQYSAIMAAEKIGMQK